MCVCISDCVYTHLSSEYSLSIMSVVNDLVLDTRQLSCVNCHVSISVIFTLHVYSFELKLFSHFDLFNNTMPYCKSSVSLSTGLVVRAFTHTMKSSSFFHSSQDCGAFLKFYT